MNPILAREIRSRFRERSSFLLLFALTLILCITAAWIYNDAYFGALNNFSNERASDIGRRLFRSLATLNCVAWLLVAPALTATGLSRERERGLLESLWLSPFKVRSQIGGRYAASLGFLAMLQLTTAPFYGIAMLLGGVSPGEVGLCGLIIAMTAVLGAALGLWCSARAYRPMSALGSALGIIVMWSLAAAFGPMLFASVFTYFNVAWIIQILNVMALPHPLLLLLNAINDGGPMSFFSPVLFWAPDKTYQFGLGAQAVTTLFLLFRAIKIASKPLPDMAWIGRHPLLEKWKRRLDARKTGREERLETARMSERVGEKVGGALLYEVPLERLARFRDPLLQREVRGRFRLRQSGLAVAIGRLAALFVIVIVWMWMISGLFFADSRVGLGVALLYLLLFLGVLVVGVLSSSSLSRERESGTWEGLHLSLLSPHEIVRSKWLSPLVTFAFWSAPLWMWLPATVQWPFGWSGNPFLPTIGAIVLVIFALGAASALGIFVSSRLRHSAAATSWTLMGLLTLFALLPMAAEGSGFKNYVMRNVLNQERSYSYYSDRNNEEVRQWDRVSAIFDAYSPIMTLDQVLSTSRYRRLDDDTRLLVWLICAGDCALLSAALLYGARRQLRKVEK